MKAFSKTVLLALFLTFGCATKKYKDVPYLDNRVAVAEKPTLNIFIPRNGRSDNPVLLFVHGGSWNSGDKKTYSFFGRNFAKKGITTVIVGYTLSPKTNYDGMAKEVAAAVEWAKANISKYHGDPNQIYLTGHSAGGHLVALVATNPKYLKDRSNIKGVILNDAAGLDMKRYLDNNPPTDQAPYLSPGTWSTNPDTWRDASPIYFVDQNTPKFMIYVGSRTYYEFITAPTTRFIEALHPYQPDLKPIILNKGHKSIIMQYIFPWNKRFDEIKEFMAENKAATTSLSGVVLKDIHPDHPGESYVEKCE